MIKSMVDYSLNMERNREVIRALKKRIAELENIINAQVFPSSGDGFSSEYIKGYEKALSDLDKILKEQE
jgi:hypothetical protein